MIYLFTFLLAACSIIYELLLGQTLSAFLGNTVLRYSITIGLYMLCMGIGAMLATKRIIERPVVWLMIVELSLAVLGGYSLFLLFLTDAVLGRTIAVSVVAHTLICAIGILTGLEIPLLIALKNLKSPNSESGVLGIDYIGAFAGTLAFAFYFYPQTGLTETAFLVAATNSLVGVLLITQWRSIQKGEGKVFSGLLGGQLAILLSLLYCLSNSSDISTYFTNLYLRL